MPSSHLSPSPIYHEPSHLQHWQSWFNVSFSRDFSSPSPPLSSLCRIWREKPQTHPHPMLPMELSREKEVPGRCELPVSSDRDMCHWHNLWSARKCQREIPCGSAVLPWKSPWAPPPDPCGSHCSHHGVSVRLGFQGEIRHWRSYFTYLPTFLVWHFSICSVSLKIEWFLVDFVPLPAFGYIWNTLVLLLSPDLALESLIHLSECRHTIVVGLDVHTCLPHVPANTHLCWITSLS